MGGFGSILVEKDRLLQLAPSRPGGVDEQGGNGAPVKCGWEDVAFKPIHDVDKTRKFLSILA